MKDLNNPYLGELPSEHSLSIEQMVILRLIYNPIQDKLLRDYLDATVKLNININLN